MFPAGPLSTTRSGEMLSSRQPFSASPSDTTRELVPVMAKIAMRKPGADHDASEPHIAQW